MSLILILSYRLREVTNSNISGTRFQIVMGFGSKYRIVCGQVDYIENSKLNIADMRLISLDRVILCSICLKMMCFYIILLAHIIFSMFKATSQSPLLLFFSHIFNPNVQVIHHYSSLTCTKFCAL